MIEDLVKQYIGKERTIIVAAIQCADDFNNQVGLRVLSATHSFLGLEVACKCFEVLACNSIAVPAADMHAKAP
jgi:hypothetical protein